MNDNLNNTDFELDDDVYPDRNDNRDRRNFKPALYISIIAILVIAVMIVSYYAFLHQSDYEKGIQFLGQKQYKEALYKFQEIPPTSKDYNNAQSKINYINGVILFDEKNYADAKEFLTKVNLNDEYYNEVKLMLERIEDILQAEDLARQLDTDDKDRLVEAEIELEQKIKNQEAARNYSRSLIRLQDRFASEFRLAELEDAGGMRKNLRNMNDIRQQMLDLTYESTEPEQQLAEFKSLLESWMNNRINVIQQAIRENVPNIVESSVTVKNMIADGDKIEEEIIQEMEKINRAYN